MKVSALNDNRNAITHHLRVIIRLSDRTRCWQTMLLVYLRQSAFPLPSQAHFSINPRVREASFATSPRAGARRRHRSPLGRRGKKGTTAAAELESKCALTSEDLLRGSGNRGERDIRGSCAN